MRLRAKVKKATENYEAYYAAVIHDPLELVEIDRIPCPDYIEIVDEVERNIRSFLILYYDKNGEFLTDSWCQTLEDAKERAYLEFEITEDDWEVIEQ
jgi:hypothetical protein